MKTILQFSVILLFFHAAFVESVSVSIKTQYPAFCARAAENEEIFANFKRDPIYQKILEHLDYETGQRYLKEILRSCPEFVSLFDKFRENDALGNPLTYDYAEYGRFSPTTLRYIKVACDIKKWWVI